MIDIPEDDIREENIRPAAGPGGQHVNRTANAVRLSFAYLRSEVLGESAKARLVRLAGEKICGEELVITAREFRSLQRNREAARARLEELLEEARKEPKKRKATKATRASKERRLAGKSRRSGVKAMRGKRIGPED